MKIKQTTEEDYSKLQYISYTVAIILHTVQETRNQGSTVVSSY
jgi:hypothetical protein